MRQAVCPWPVIRKFPAQSQVSTRGISGGTSEKETGFSPSISVSHFQYHGARDAYAFTYLPPTLHNLAIDVIKQNTRTHLRYSTSGVDIHLSDTGLNLFVLEWPGMWTYETLKYSKLGRVKCSQTQPRQLRCLLVITRKLHVSALCLSSGFLQRNLVSYYI
jgi:hypothetical protein